MSHFLGHKTFVKMFFFVFIVLIFLETPTIARGRLDLLAELSSRDELVDWAGYGEEKLSTVVIDGKLLCHADNTSIHPYPISGASVAVICGTSRKTKKSWGKSRTDSYGDFVIDLPSHLHAIPNLEKICCVKVVHLPTSSPCQKSVTRKHKGIELASIREGIRSYTAHNIHLMPPHKHT
ncbi:hypothetical protein BUALT_Bualt03G0091700 [Buddleja alternifolia]|uniref:Pollen Ole e 1 allergen and extensin family protein n=1 Tax=Buddleja alternifolia TaxID=168488 RepID=A0AAV6XSA4_9LAMI|nr:hypothetical protein BUALT_Bualt03G0091700 [Buddleja alternifolia]